MEKNEHKAAGDRIDELIEYLNEYKDKGCEYISFCAVDVKRRKVANVVEAVFLTDTENPVAFIVFEGESDFSEEEKAMAEECERDAE